jgi:hypothetical protein
MKNSENHRARPGESARLPGLSGWFFKELARGRASPRCVGHARRSLADLAAKAARPHARVNKQAMRPPLAALQDLDWIDVQRSSHRHDRGEQSRANDGETCCGRSLSSMPPCMAFQR